MIRAPSFAWRGACQGRNGAIRDLDVLWGSRQTWLVVALAPLLVIGATTALGHAISEDNASYVEALDGPAIPAFTYLGAKHMVTGIDHLLFLVGVVFFLYRLKDVLLYVSLFTLGHSITLLTGVLAEWKVDAYVVDAIIGLSVVYKAFENMGGFERVFGFTPNTRVAVLVFGLFHGLGLATKVQELALSDNGLVTNLVSFNVGVELGHIQRGRKAVSPGGSRSPLGERARGRQRDHRCYHGG